MSHPDDAINSVLLNARRQLHELQKNLNDPNVEYSQILSQISETTNRIQNEAETMSSVSPTESALIPLVGPKKKPSGIQKPQNNATPREYHPFKVNKASNLRKQLAPKPQRQKTLPRLLPEDKNLSATELMAQGKIRNFDDAGELFPVIDGKRDAINAPLFPTIQIDIKGAAKAFRDKKIKQKQKNAAINKEIQQLQKSTLPPRIFEEEEENDFDKFTKEIELKTDDSSRHPRLYEELQDEYAYQTLLIVRGKIARETPDFESFKRTNESQWIRIDNVLQSIESFCEKYEIQFAEINGRKLSEAALLNIITENDIHACLVGVDELIKKKKNEAALVIQNFWRRMLQLKNKEMRKRLFWAAYSIQSFWRNMTSKKYLMRKIKNNLNTVDQKAFELSQSLLNKFREIEDHNYVITHVIATPQDLSRCFDLMYRNAELILLLSKIPAAHIWEEFLEVLAQCGVEDANSRIHFIVLQEQEGELRGVSNRLKCDMKSVQLTRRYICGRTSFLIPHPDWSAERTFSVDINLPIFGVTDTTMLQSRAAIKSIFSEAGIVPTFSTHESRELAPLISEALDMMHENIDIKNWIVRLGFTQADSGIAWFELSDDFLNEDVDLGALLKKSLHCIGSVQSFLAQIKNVGAMIEAVPENIHSFPSVSLFLTGNEIRVIGTFDRLNYAPFRFACSLIPSVSVDSVELIAMAKQVGAVLLKRKVIGYVSVDFLAFKEEEEIRILGFDVRINSYPASLTTSYMNLCCGYSSEKNKMLLLSSVNAEPYSSVSSRASTAYGSRSSSRIGDASRTGLTSSRVNGTNRNRDTDKSFGPSINAKRFAVVHNCITHPGLQLVSTKELKKVCFSQGLMFDLLNRTGFRMVFYDSPAEGKGFAISAATTPIVALDKMEKSYQFLLRYLGQKVGSDASSSISHTLTSIRHFKSNVTL